VKSFIADLSAQAEEKPLEPEPWLKLGRVTARAARFDPSYTANAIGAFHHALEVDPKNAQAMRGLADIYYEHDDHQQAIPYYEQYLALEPDDVSARTDLGTMYLSAGDAPRAIATYREVVRRQPSFLQAHYNLAVTYHREGDDRAALRELQIARGLASEDGVRGQIDEMIASLSGAPSPPATASPRLPFQSAVEAAFRAHPILGPRIVRFEWGGPGAGRVLVQNFPMEGMPPAVREKFTTRLGQEMRTAEGSHPVEGPVRMEIADAASGAVMATVTP
jgi:cytochrome c-type biogenesis protein CcmH/NrfG